MFETIHRVAVVRGGIEGMMTFRSFRDEEHLQPSHLLERVLEQERLQARVQLLAHPLEQHSITKLRLRSGQQERGRQTH